MMKRIVVPIIFAFTAILMTGCSSDSTPAPAVLTGTAATGAPIDGTVFVKDAKGDEKSVATASDGSFTLDVPDMTPPYLLKIRTASGTDLYSFASENGQTVNLTPITNLAMFLAYGKKDLNDLYTAWDGKGVSSAQVDDAEAVVRANLESQITAKNIDAASFNLFTSAFKADGSGIDGLMDELKIVVEPGTGYSFTDADGNPDPMTDTFDEGIDPIAPPAGGSGGTGFVASIADLNGTWIKCQEETGFVGSFRTILVMNNGTGTFSSYTYTDTACTAGESLDQDNIAVTMSVGPKVSLASSSITGITEASELNAVLLFDVTQPPENVYTIVGILDGKMYLGDNKADAALDESAPDKRPNTFQPAAFVKQ